jgi:hypothetical protein
MKNAISYLRFSSPKQASNDSYRRQIEATEKFCKENGLALSNRLEDLGVSAWSGKNLGDDAALGSFLKLVEAGKIPKGTCLSDAIVKSDSSALVARLTKLEIERKKLESDYADEVTNNMSKSDVKSDYYDLMDKMNKGLEGNSFRLTLRNLIRKHIAQIKVKSDGYQVFFKDNNETLTIVINKENFDVNFWEEWETYDYLAFKNSKDEREKIRNNTRGIADITPELVEVK